MQTECGSVCSGVETVGWHDKQLISVFGAEELRTNVICSPDLKLPEAGDKAASQMFSVSEITCSALLIRIKVSMGKVGNGFHPPCSLSSHTTSQPEILSGSKPEQRNEITRNMSIVAAIYPKKSCLITQPPQSASDLSNSVFQHWLSERVLFFLSQRANKKELLYVTAHQRKQRIFPFHSNWDTCFLSSSRKEIIRCQIS